MVTVVYGFARPTADMDVLTVVPRGEVERLIELAGKGSALHRKHGLYLDLVTVATVSENYEQRLAEVAAGAFKRLRLLAPRPLRPGARQARAQHPAGQGRRKAPRPDDSS